MNSSNLFSIIGLTLSVLTNACMFSTASDDQPAKSDDAPAVSNVAGASSVGVAPTIPAAPYDIYVSDVGMEPDELDSVIKGIDAWNQLVLKRGARAFNLKGIVHDPYEVQSWRDGVIVVYAISKDDFIKSSPDGVSDKTAGQAAKANDVILAVQSIVGNTTELAQWEDDLATGRTTCSPDQRDEVRMRFWNYHLGEVQAIATHELGHVLGLDHSTDNDDIMYPATNHWKLLSDDDLDAFCVINVCP